MVLFVDSQFDVCGLFVAKIDKVLSVAFIRMHSVAVHVIHVRITVDYSSDMC